MFRTILAVVVLLPAPALAKDMLTLYNGTNDSLTLCVRPSGRGGWVIEEDIAPGKSGGIALVSDDPFDVCIRRVIDGNLVEDFGRRRVPFRQIMGNVEPGRQQRINLPLELWGVQALTPAGWQNVVFRETVTNFSVIASSGSATIVVGHDPPRPPIIKK